MFLFLRERECARAQVGEGQRERETQNPKEAPGSELSTRSLTRGSNPQTVRSWPELELDAPPTELPRGSCLFYIYYRSIGFEESVWIFYHPSYLYGIKFRYLFQQFKTCCPIKCHRAQWRADECHFCAGLMTAACPWRQPLVGPAGAASRAICR